MVLFFDRVRLMGIAVFSGAHSCLDVHNCSFSFSWSTTSFLHARTAMVHHVRGEPWLVLHEGMTLKALTQLAWTCCVCRSDGEKKQESS